MHNIGCGGTGQCCGGRAGRRQLGRSWAVTSVARLVKCSPGPAQVTAVATVSKSAWSPLPNTVYCGLRPAPLGRCPRARRNRCCQQLPAAVGLVSPPAAAAVSLGVSVPAVEAMPMATAGARSIEVGVPGAVQESVGTCPWWPWRRT